MPPIISKQSCMNLKIENINIENSTCKKLVGVKVDKKLNFNEHLDGIIKKASRKELVFSLSWTCISNEFILQFTIQLMLSHLDVS